MTSFVHEFDAREEGRFRVSLTYDAPTAAGKTTPRTDTYHGRFVELVPNERIVEVIEFETSDPGLAGVMTVTTMLVDAAEGGTELHATHANLPPGLSPTANEAGWRESLGKLAAFVQAQEKAPRQMVAQDQAVAHDASRGEVITRVLDAPREHVWRALTGPKLFAQWRAPRGMSADVKVFDVRAGGAYDVAMIGPMSSRSASRGRRVGGSS